MKTLILGATGMVGGEVLRYCMADERVSEVLSIGRRPSGLEHPKLTEVEHNNFLDFTGLEEAVKEAALCVYCIGVYQNAVSKEKFWQITCNYQDTFVNLLERVVPEITFCLFGAQGADPSEKSWFRFAKAKGRAEKALFNSKLKAKYVFRPGYIHPSRTIPGQKNAYFYAAPIYKLFPSIGVDASKIAQVMVDVGIEGSAQSIFENSDLRAYPD